MSAAATNQKFEDYFSLLYGPRWPTMREALKKKEKQVLRLNRFAEKSLVTDQLKADSSLYLDLGSLKACEFLQDCYWRTEEKSLHSRNFEEKNLEEKKLFYIMDPASVIVAKALQACGSDAVLDLCAAPGGKSLVLAEDMFFSAETVTGMLISNEYSESRRERLLKIFQNYIPKEHRQFITVKGLDGNQYGLRMPDAFDKVLADVPCSGERHLFENASELKLWSEKRTKNLAVRQYSLLSSAWLTCKAGGRIVYSTCSISNIENDEVVKKLVKKRQVSILQLPSDISKNLPFLEKTDLGYQILPDRTGFGPMYFSVIQKN